MNTQHLSYAVAVARFGSFSRAAQSLEVGQPALSKAVSDLESSLGITIFRRSNRQVVPTEEGREFLRLAAEALRQIQAMESLKSADAGLEALKISIPPSAYILKAAADSVAGLPPGQADVLVREADAPEVLRDLFEGLCRLGIVRCSPERERYFLDAAAERRLEAVPLWEFSLRLTCSKASPLLTGESRADKLELSLNGDAPLRVSGRAAAYALLRANPLAFWLTEPMLEEELLREGLGQAPGDGQRRKDFLLYPRGYKLTNAERKWVDRLYAIKNKLAFTN